MVEGLDQWLESLDLGHFSVLAHEWCESMGAAFLEEVFDNWQDLADALELPEAARKRMHASVKAETEQSEDSVVKKPAALPRKATAFGPWEEPDRYTLWEELGSGATGRVRRSASSGGGVYAVKTIELSKLRYRPNFHEVSNMLYQEIAIQFSMQHPRIVPLYDVVEDDSTLRLVMEIIEGGNLASYIVRRRALNEAEARFIFVQIAEGLMYLHSKGIVHCDLKPENILMEKSDAQSGALPVRLMDFGHSQVLEEKESVLRTRVGTPMYWAPEISNLLDSGYDMRVDLWSLGAVLYTMLVGWCPFEGSGALLQQRIRTAEFYFPAEKDGTPGPSPQARALVHSLLRPDPADRLPLDWCFVHPWVETAAEMLRDILQNTEPLEVEESFQLPENLSSEALQVLRQDLMKWMAKFRLSAIIRHQKVVVNFGDSSKQDLPQVSAARGDMRSILRYHFSGEPLTSLEFIEKGLPSVPVTRNFRCWSSQLFACNLRVSPVFGVGLDLEAEPMGMRVLHVHSQPGQTQLESGDLIFQIDGHALCGSLALIDRTFSSHLRDDVQLAVRRDGSGEGRFDEDMTINPYFLSNDDIELEDKLRASRREQERERSRWIRQSRRSSSSSGNKAWGPSLRMRKSGRPW